VLFLFFPRIPGPLWDIGLTFGLPLPVDVEQSKQGLGISARLKPGQTQTGASDGQAVLVAEFGGWVPPTSQLYWRGPVFYDFDGQEWQLDADYAAGNGRKIMQKGWRRVADFKEKLQSTAQEVHYTVRLTPHGGLWLYGLDLPARLTSESFIGPDWQVLSHMPVQQEMRYALGSWLEWTAGGELAPDLRQRALALPAGSNPRLRALGAELASQFADGGTGALLRGALVTLSQGGYRVRDRFTPPTDANALDAFWFETKEGNAEFFAAAFVVLMRAAGVPARLVTGYRGGKLMALTDYVVVKRSHAHAWVEVWDAKKGWRRADPTDMVAPERFSSGPAKPQPALQPTPQATPAPSSSDSKPAPAPTGGFTASTAPRSMPSPALTLPDLSDWLGRWIFRLDGAQQKALLAGKGGGFAWLWLLVTAAVASALLFGASLLLARWRDKRRLPAPQRAWARACRQLAGQGLPPGPAECPLDYARRVGAARPAWAQAMTQLAEAYGAWRYGPQPQHAASGVAAAARFLSNRILAG
jgi:transglutaminase-like putative cysteine protease